VDADFEFLLTEHFTISGGLEALHATFTRFEDATISTALPPEDMRRFKGRSMESFAAGTGFQWDRAGHLFLAD